MTLQKTTTDTVENKLRHLVEHRMYLPSFLPPRIAEVFFTPLSSDILPDREHLRLLRQWHLFFYGQVLMWDEFEHHTVQPFNGLSDEVAALQRCYGIRCQDHRLALYCHRVREFRKLTVTKVFSATEIGFMADVASALGVVAFTITAQSMIGRGAYRQLLEYRHDEVALSTLYRTFHLLKFFRWMEEYPVVL